MSTSLKTVEEKSEEKEVRDVKDNLLKAREEVEEEDLVVTENLETINPLNQKPPQKQSQLDLFVPSSPSYLFYILKD